MPTAPLYNRLNQKNILVFNQSALRHEQYEDVTPLSRRPFRENSS